MRKLILGFFLLALLQDSVFAQRYVKQLRTEIDSLWSVLPHLRGRERIDCLVMISDRFNDIPVPDLQQQIDSSWPLALQAFNEAKKIGYKKGLGYALLRMGECEDSKDDRNLTGNNRNDPGIIRDYNSCINYFKQAIAIGEEIDDHVIQGYAYGILAWLEEKRDNMKGYMMYMSKCVSEYKKAGKEIFEGRYRERGFVNRPGLRGNELWVAGAYLNMGRANLGEIDPKLVKPYFDSAYLYFEKLGSKREMAKWWTWYRGLLTQLKDVAGVEEAIRKTISLYEEDGELEAALNESIALCSREWNQGNFEKGIEYAKKCLTITDTFTISNPNYRLRGQTFYWLSRFYNSAGDYQGALDLVQKARIYYPDDSTYMDEWINAIGETYRYLGRYDSALFYLQQPAKGKIWNTYRGRRIYLSELYVDLKQYDKALETIGENIKMDGGGSGLDLTIAAKAWAGKGNFNNALIAARKGIVELKARNRRARIIDNYEIMAEIFHGLGRDDSAFYYQKQYFSLRDSLLSRQFYWRLSNFRKEAEENSRLTQFDLLNKENQLKSQQLKQEGLTKKILVAGLLVMLILAGFIYRNMRLKRKNEKLALQRQAIDLEMQALRSQMNPHFIFNCLSSINRFILKNEVDAASEYLTRFSRLIRMVLINSQKSVITLEEELEMLRLYLDMERMRFKKSFDYKISFLNEIDAGAVFIPPLLLQPFCENAIWHGLMHNEGQGRLDITMRMDGEGLCCTISDNGIGREKAAEIRSRSAEQRKSFGLKITRDRLALLNRESLNGNSYEIEDRFDENGNAIGTRVVLMIGKKELIK